MVGGFCTVSEEKNFISLKYYVLISRDVIPLSTKVHLCTQLDILYILWIKLKCLMNFYIFERKILCIKCISDHRLLITPSSLYLTVPCSGCPACWWAP